MSWGWTALEVLLLESKLNFLTPARRKRAFVSQLPHSSKLLDVGCGTGSPLLVKSIRSDIHYVGLDVGDYHQTEESKACADQYLITSPEKFDETISQQGAASFDAVVSNHNLEHCNYPDRVLRAMCDVLRPGGQLYLAFPTEASVSMPSRRGTLNFYDDPTHRTVPNWEKTLGELSRQRMNITFAAQRYRPLASVLIGLAFEPFVAPIRRQAPKNATWALYGFESIIWAVKDIAG